MNVLNLKDEDAVARSRHLADMESRLDYDSSAAGILRQVMAEGESDLTERQRYVFDAEVIGERRCAYCVQLIPWGELTAAKANGGLCSSCDGKFGSNE